MKSLHLNASLFGLALAAGQVFFHGPSFTWPQALGALATILFILLL